MPWGKPFKMKRLLILFSILFILEAPSLLFAQETEKPKAEITLSNDNVWEGHLSGRKSDDGVMFQVKGRDRMIAIGKQDISKIRFKIDFDMNELDEMLETGKYLSVLKSLHTFVSEGLRYTDIEHNLTEPARRYLLSIAWTKNYKTGAALCEKIERKNWLPEMAGTVRMVKVLCQMGLDDIKAAEESLQNVSRETLEETDLPIYLYTVIQYNEKKGDWAKVQQVAGELVATQLGSSIWMPMGLYYSGLAYEKNESLKTAHQVMKEVGMVFPESPWAAKAKAWVNLHPHDETELDLNTDDLKEKETDEDNNAPENQV